MLNLLARQLLMLEYRCHATRLRHNN